MAPDERADEYLATDDPPLSPGDSLALIERERRAAEDRLEPHPLLFFGSWGVAWLVGYGLYFLRYGPDDRVLVAMPEWLPRATMLALIVSALAVSVFAGYRAYSHVAGESSERGTMYGLSWCLSFASFGIFVSRFDDLLPVADAGLLWGSFPVFITATLYMAGGAVWRDRYQFAFGVWLSVVNAAGLFAGPGWHSLIVSLAGGGGFLATAAFYAWRPGRTRGEAALGAAA